MTRTTTREDVIWVARGLLSGEDSPNREYDRALAELIADVFEVPGVPLDVTAAQVALELGKGDQR